jgi:imidazolonepropionase-like amidohydrolase
MRICLTNARLIDVRHGKVLPGYTVLIAGRRIVAVAPAAELQIPPDAMQIDLGHRTLLPGFIDCHAHVGAIEYNLEKRLSTPASLTVLRTAANLRNTLEAGVTTVREAGGIDAGLKNAIDEGLIPGPRLQVSLMMIVQTGGMWDLHMGAGASLQTRGMMGEVARYCGGIEPLRQLSRELLAAGADLLNIHTTGSIHKHPDEIPTAAFSPEEIETVVYEAHKAGKKVMAHVDGGPGVADSIRAGVDSVDHPYYLTDGDIDLLLRHDTLLVPTLSCNHGILRIAARDPGAGIHATALEAARRILPHHEDGFRRAVRAGVRIAMGSDSYGRFQADNLLELELMVANGMTAMQALRAGTLEGARLMGLEDNIGSIEPGKTADLVVVDADPLTDIRSLQERERLCLIMKDGHLHKNILEPCPS